MNSLISNNIHSVFQRYFFICLLVSFFALFFSACGTEAENGKITTAYGVSLENVPQKEDVDSIRVFVVISGDTTSSELYDANEINDDLLVFNIDAPSEASVRVIYTVYAKGFSVAAGNYLFLSGDTPEIPDPKLPPKITNLIQSDTLVGSRRDSIGFRLDYFTSSNSENVISFQWDFDGDGNYDISNETSDSIVTAYELPGVYSGKVLITDELGLSDSADFQVDVYSSVLVDSRDGQEYSIVDVGSQVWMAGNLNYSGDDGSGNKTYEVGWCYGVGGTDTTNHSDSTTCDTYGRLYTWDMVMDGAVSSDANPSGVQGLCPSGWHVPSDAEWTEMEDFLIAHTEGARSSDIAPFLKATSGWKWSSVGEGTDDFGFSALPSGDRNYYNGNFIALGSQGHWWSATEDDSALAWIRTMSNASDLVFRTRRNSLGGLSLRCLQD